MKSLLIDNTKNIFCTKKFSALLTNTFAIIMSIVVISILVANLLQNFY